MARLEIGHKLRVFISSKCGGKYSIARKALKTLLEATGLIEVYAFETEPASSEDTKSAYLENIDESNLCIFLVDNYDGVPAAVLSEEKRAKDKGLRLIYIFCDEAKKEPTPMQQEIRDNLTQKYDRVHEFSDIVDKAYISVLQDLIAIYRRKNEQFADIDNENQPSTTQNASTPLTQRVNLLEKDRYPSSSYVKHALMTGILPIFPSDKNSTPSNLENCLATQLNVVLDRVAFNEESFKEIKTEILALQDPAIKELIDKRLEAQQSFFQAKYEECLKQLQDALSIAIDNKCIPTWLVNDVAIDIRHVFAQIDDLNNQFTFDNPGQKYIDESRESVYYPLLDRQVENMQEAIANRYYSELSASPYSKQYGGLEDIFKNLANAFYIAQMHGSIVHTILCKDRLISILSMLCTLYDDHDFIVDLIRLLIVNQDSKKLDSLIRTYNQYVEIINTTDVKRILDSVLCISDQTHAYKAKYLLVSRLGYYMDEGLYQDLYGDLLEYAMNWAIDEQAVISLSTFIFDFLRENTHRADLEKTGDFIVAIFTSGKSRFYHDCFKVLQNIDYSRMSLPGQRKTRTLLTGILSGRIKYNFDYESLSACIRFCKSATVPYKQIEKMIEKKHPKYYEETFKLEMSLIRNDDPIKYIFINLAEANARNETQGKNGHYSGYIDEPFETIFNIISYSDCEIKETLLVDLLNSSINTLAQETQTVSAKISAIKLLQLLYFKTRNSEAWKAFNHQIVDNRAKYTSGFEMSLFRKDTLNVLSFTFDLFASCFDPDFTNQVIEDVYCLDQRDSFSIIRCLKVISDYLKVDVGRTFNVRILEALLYFSISMAQNRERDVKYYATTCLIGLTGLTATQDIAVTHLSQIMDKGSQPAKIAILSRVGQIKCDDDSFIEQIFNKGKADSNYLVRFVAEREQAKRTS